LIDKEAGKRGTKKKITNNKVNGTHPRKRGKQTKKKVENKMIQETKPSETVGLVTVV
jgi:hypothetical protein